MKNYLVRAATACYAASTTAQAAVDNADGDFTQENCDKQNKFYVDKLSQFTGTEDDWPCSYAGTLASNSDGTHQDFFWMYPATEADAPVSIWLNGGPGASSAFANFLFSSPLRIAQDGTTFTMYKSEDTWIS